MTFDEARVGARVRSTAQVDSDQYFMPGTVVEVDDKYVRVHWDSGVTTLSRPHTLRLLPDPGSS